MEIWKWQESGPTWEGKDSIITNAKMHEWYIDAAKGAQEFLLLKITKDHFLGKDSIHIEFYEFFQLFNQDALDKSLVSSYVL
jgi:hypothetical protein